MIRKIFHVESSHLEVHEVVKEIIVESLRTHELLDDMLDNCDLDDAVETFTKSVCSSAKIKLKIDFDQLEKGNYHVEQN